MNAMRQRTTNRRRLLLAAAVSLAAGAGCGYRPGGQGWKGSSETWRSTEFLPATLTLVDTRSGEEVWTQDIPVGYQMVTRFIDGGGPDRIERPDRLEYQIFQNGTRYGKLRSAVAVPPANCRRWELTYREAPEYAEDGLRNGFFGNMPPWLELPPRRAPDLSEDKPLYEK